MIRKHHRRGWFGWRRRAPDAYRAPRFGWFSRTIAWVRFQLGSLLLGSDRPAWGAARKGDVAWRWARILTWPIWFPFWLVGAGLLALFSGISELLLRFVQPVGGQRLWHLLAATPAIITMAITGWLILRIDLQADALPETYARLAEREAKAKRLETAALYWQRVIDDRGDPEARFKYAELLDEMGRTQGALALMKRLAPDDRPGNSKAHKYMAIRYTAAIASLENPKVENPELVKVAKWHLDHAADQTSREVLYAWGQYYLIEGNLLKAIEKIELASQVWPELNHVLGELYRSVEPQKAAQSLRKAAQHYSRTLKDEPLNHEARKDLADVLIRLRQTSQAIELLQDGLRLDQDAPFRQLLARAFVKRFDEELSHENPDYSFLMSALKSAFEYDLGCESALERITALCVGRSPEQRQELRALIERTDGQAPAITHFALAILDYLDGDRAKSSWHLEQALRIDADLPFARNNLAMLLIEGDSPDFVPALSYWWMKHCATPRRPSGSGHQRASVDGAGEIQRVDRCL